MKRVLLAAAALMIVASAQAADLPARPVYKAPAIPMAYNWSGFYIGGHLGWGWHDADATLVSAPAGSPLPPGTVVSTSSDGFLGGVQAGVNWQFNQWVLGIEGDFSWTNATANSVTLSAIPVAGTTVTGFSTYNWFATATARAGWTWQNWLAYVKGGAAFANLDFGGSNVVPGVGTFVVNPFSDTRTGWTVGVGLEYGFANNWSAKVEYNYMDFGSESYTTNTTPALGPSVISHDLTVQAVKVGLNYRFGPMR